MTSPLLVFFGRHKCATRYVTSVLTGYGGAIGVKFENASSLVEPRAIDWNLRNLGTDARILRASPYPSLIRAALEKYQIAFRGFHLVRDPRDMVVSGYFSHRYSHPDRWNFQKQHFQELKTLPQEEGLRAEIDYTGWLELDDMLTWDTSTDNILEVRYEDLIADPVAVFSNIFEFGRLPLQGEILAAILEQLSFERLSGGRKPGEEDVTHHYRRGVPGDWKRYLNDSNLEYFMERYGSLLAKYGYT